MLVTSKTYSYIAIRSSKGRKRKRHCGKLRFLEGSAVSVVRILLSFKSESEEVESKLWEVCEELNRSNEVVDMKVSAVLSETLARPSGSRESYHRAPSGQKYASTSPLLQTGIIAALRLRVPGIFRAI